MTQVDPQGRSWKVKPTKKGMQTQYGGTVPKDPKVAYFVFRLSDITDENTPVSAKDLIQASSSGEEDTFTYATAYEAQRLGYALLVL